MPTYTYECPNCGLREDLFHGINETVEKRCPRCGGLMRRLVGAGVGVLFKGSGFYITDYANAKKPQKSGEKKQETKSAEGSKDNE